MSSPVVWPLAARQGAGISVLNVIDGRGGDSSLVLPAARLPPSSAGFPLAAEYRFTESS